MRQRISTEQLKELDAQQLQALNSWWHPELGDLYSNGIGNDYGVVNYEDMDRLSDTPLPENVYPLMSIGQCITLLTEKVEVKVEEPKKCWWRVMISTRVSMDLVWFNADGEEIDFQIFSDPYELIIPLWEAVKVVLRGSDQPPEKEEVNEELADLRRIEHGIMYAMKMEGEQ